MCQTSSSTPLSDLIRRGFAAADDAASTDLARAVARQVQARAGTAAEPAPIERSSRRRRLWELPRNVFCPVLGTCLTIDRLRRLTVAVLPDCAAVDDYELHCRAIAESARRSELAERLQRELDARFERAVRQARAIKGAAALVAHWRQACLGSEVAAALWVTLTHPDCDAALEEQVQRDIHMLQHQAGVGVRADVQRLDTLQRENIALGRELAAAQQRTTQMLAEKSAQTERQQAELVRLRARLITCDTTIDDLRTQVAQLEDASPSLRSRQAMARQIEQQQARIRELEMRLQDSRRQLQAQRPSERTEAVRPAPVAVPDTPVIVAAATEMAGEDLRDKAVLCVGGRTASVPVYRQLVEVRGARFLHHDGGEEDAAGQLDAHLAAADLVICQAGCISHNAYWRVKDHCRRTGKQCVFVDRPSASGLVRGLEQASSAAAAAAQVPPN
ncbi:MAG: hypothetical protein RL654_1192 [Pseudomonadota bacterium]|jgi:hypothetical protein